MKQRYTVKKWLLYIVINQLIQFIYLGYALFWFNHIAILMFYILNVVLINSFCFIIEVYNIENRYDIHRVIGVCIYITWYFIFEINNVDRLLVLPLTQLIVWWVSIDYIFQGYKDRKIGLLKMFLYISFGGVIYSWLVSYKIFLIFYQAMIILLLVFPILIVALKKSMLNKYGLKIKKKINVLVILSSILLVEVLVGANNSVFYLWNIDYDLYIVTIILFLMYIVVKNLRISLTSFKILMYEAAIILRVILLILALLIGIIIVKKHENILILVCIFAFLISLQIHVICNIEKKYRFSEQTDISNFELKKI